MRNISSIIASHNKSVLRPKAKQCGCSYRNKESCPLQNQYLTPKIVTTRNEYNLALQIQALRSDIPII